MQSAERLLFILFEGFFGELQRHVEHLRAVCLCYYIDIPAIGEKHKRLV